MGENTIAFMIDVDSPHNVGQPAYEIEGKTSIYKWLKNKEGVYAMVQDSETVDKVESGIFTLFADNRGGIHISPYTLQTDELFVLPHNHVKEVISEIDDFWKKAAKYKANKIKHKRGILFEGPGGCGKSSILNMLASELVKDDGLVFIIRNNNELVWFMDFMQDNLRIADPDRPVIALLEDLDKYCDNGGLESMILNWLDGDQSVDHLIVVATTNYYQNLSDLMLRPSRFDHHVHIPKPPADVREAYLINKGVKPEFAKKWGKDTDDFSLAELKELFISTILLDLDYEKAKAKIKGQSEAVVKNVSKNSRKKTDSMGFKLGNKD